MDGAHPIDPEDKLQKDNKQDHSENAHNESEDESNDDDIDQGQNALLKEDILEKIADYVDLETLKRCRQVCTTWHVGFDTKFRDNSQILARFNKHFAYNKFLDIFDPAKFDLSKHRAIVFQSTYMIVTEGFKDWIRNYGISLTKVVLGGCKVENQVYRIPGWRQWIRSLLTNWCPNLQEFEVHSVIPDYGPEPYDRDELITDLKHRAKLKRLVVCHVNIPLQQSTYPASILNEIFNSVEKVDNLRIELEELPYAHYCAAHLRIPQRIVKSLLKLELKGFYLSDDKYLFGTIRDWKSMREKMPQADYYFIYDVWDTMLKLHLDCEYVPLTNFRRASKLTNLSLNIGKDKDFLGWKEDTDLDFLLETPSLERLEMTCELHPRLIQWPKAVSRLKEQTHDNLQTLKLNDCMGIKLSIICECFPNLKHLEYNTKSDEKNFVSNIIAVFSHPKLEYLSIAPEIRYRNLRKIMRTYWLTSPKEIPSTSNLKTILVAGKHRMRPYSMIKVLQDAFKAAPLLTSLAFKDFTFKSDEHQAIRELISERENMTFHCSPPIM